MYKKVLEISAREIGYLEKKTNDKLDSKKENAGSNNFTKYGEAMGCNACAWCDAFVDWCFVSAYGKENAKKLLGGFSNYTPTSAQNFKNSGRFHKTNPKPGDVIFFKNSLRICHTGIVEKVVGNEIDTIEGNTSGGTKIIPNGGEVCRKRYNLNNPRIAGYGRPDYSILKMEEQSKSDIKKDINYKIVQEKAKLTDQTMAFLSKHKKAKVLLRKLAKAMA